MSSIEEELHNAIPKIEQLIDDKWLSVPGLRLLIITSREWLHVYNGEMERSKLLSELTFVSKLRVKRAEILDFFSKLEFLVKEMISARILGLFSANAYEFDEMLQKITFSGCIDLLFKWRIIDSHLKRKLEKLANVRNQLAHSWNERHVFYKQDSKKRPIPLTENLEEFKTDAQEVWIGLINIHMRAEVKDLGRLISKLSDYNTINAWTEISRGREPQE